MSERKIFPVEVRPATDPAGYPAVLLQLPEGYVVIRPEDAAQLATMLADCAVEVAQMIASQ